MVKLKLVLVDDIGDMDVLSFINPKIAYRASDRSLYLSIQNPSTSQVECKYEFPNNKHNRMVFDVLMYASLIDKDENLILFSSSKRTFLVYGFEPSTDMLLECEDHIMDEVITVIGDDVLDIHNKYKCEE